jgi:hypothetical protein
MSTELKGVDTINDHIFLTSYYGGSRNGMCLQLTPQTNSYIQLTKTQALNLALALIEFHKDIREEIQDD